MMTALASLFTDRRVKPRLAMTGEMTLSGQILPVGGTVTPDPSCGFHNYNSPLDIAALSFVARHPNDFATYSFATALATNPPNPGASTFGTVGDAGSNGFNKVGAFTYSKDVIISTLLTAVFFMLWHAHQVIYDLDRTFKAQRVGAQQEQHLQQLISERGLADRAIHERHPQQS